MAMHPDLATAYRSLRKAFEDVARLEISLLPAIQASTDKATLADAAYGLRELENLGEEIRKRSRRHKEIAEKMCCAICTVMQEVDAIKTDYVTAAPKIDLVASLPHRSTDPENYARLMDYLGIRRELWEGAEHAAVQPHWPGIIDMIGKQQAAGEPLPPGVDPDKTYAKYSLLMRGKRGPAD